MSRDGIQVGFVAKISYNVTMCAAVVLPIVSTGAAYFVARALAVFSPDSFLLGSALAAVFTWTAVDALHAATLANAVCVLQQRAADASAVPGTPEYARRYKMSSVEEGALLLLGGGFDAAVKEAAAAKAAAKKAA